MTTYDVILEKLREKGGAGSGYKKPHFGRPGMVGGSLSREEGSHVEIDYTERWSPNGVELLDRFDNYKGIMLPNGKIVGGGSHTQILAKIALDHEKMFDNYIVRESRKVLEEGIFEHYELEEDIAIYIGSDMYKLSFNEYDGWEGKYNVLDVVGFERDEMPRALTAIKRALEDERIASEYPIKKVVFSFGLDTLEIPYDELDLVSGIKVGQFRPEIRYKERQKGGKGSGHFYHAGRPGEVGGSLPKGEYSHPETEKVVELQSGVYEILDASEMPNFRLSMVNLKSRRVFGNYSSQGMIHEDLLSFIDDTHNIDHYVRFWTSDELRGTLITSIHEAGVVHSGDESEKEALENIYRALDWLVGKGLPKNTKVRIYMGFSDKIDTTAKEFTKKGGVGSGHFGHAGRIGKVGGSLPKGESSGETSLHRIGDFYGYGLDTGNPYGLYSQQEEDPRYKYYKGRKKVEYALGTPLFELDDSPLTMSLGMEKDDYGRIYDGFVSYLPEHTDEALVYSVVDQDTVKAINDYFDFPGEFEAFYAVVHNRPKNGVTNFMLTLWGDNSAGTYYYPVARISEDTLYKTETEWLNFIKGISGDNKFAYPRLLGSIGSEFFERKQEFQWKERTKGGTGSGYKKPHYGIPGHQGGSLPRASGQTSEVSHNTQLSERAVKVQEMIENYVKFHGFYGDTVDYVRKSRRVRGLVNSIKVYDSYDEIEQDYKDDPNLGLKRLSYTVSPDGKLFFYDIGQEAGLNDNFHTQIYSAIALSNYAPDDITDTELRKAVEIAIEGNVEDIMMESYFLKRGWLSIGRMPEGVARSSTTYVKALAPITSNRLVKKLLRLVDNGKVKLNTDKVLLEGMFINDSRVEQHALVDTNELDNISNFVDNGYGQLIARTKGGEGSGYYNEPEGEHRGRPGYHGGSLPRDGSGKPDSEKLTKLKEKIGGRSILVYQYLEYFTPEGVEFAERQLSDSQYFNNMAEIYWHDRTGYETNEESTIKLNREEYYEFKDYIEALKKEREEIENSLTPEQTIYERIREAGYDPYAIESMEAGSPERKAVDEILDNYAKEIYNKVKEHGIENFTQDEIDRILYKQWEDETAKVFGKPLEEVSKSGDNEYLKLFDAFKMADRKLDQMYSFEVNRQISAGIIEPEYAKNIMSFSGGGASEIDNDDWKELPKDLFHVTTNFDGIMENGIKSRFELAMRQGGTGLGGGDSTTISFSSELGICQDIERSIHQAWLVASGKVKISDMLKIAYKGGDGVGKNWAYAFVDLISEGDFGLPRGVSESEYNPFVHGLPGKILIMLEAEESGVPPENRYFEDTTEMTWSVFSKYLYARQQAGGYENPVFFSTDYKALARLDPSGIRTMQYKRANSNAKGKQMSGLGEWRVVGDTAVKFIKEYNFIIDPFDINEVFDLK